jgi:LysM repeat protein
VATPSTEARDMQLEILTQAVHALQQEVARNDTRAEELLKENQRLRDEVNSLLRDLAKSREQDQRLRKRLQALEDQLREIAKAPPLAAADRLEGRDKASEVSPQARTDASKQAGGSPTGGVPRGERAQGRSPYHVVVAGDTLFRIATAYGVDYRDLARENGIEDLDHIEVGQRIFIPGATRAP